MLIAAAGIGAFVMQMRADAIESATTNAGNLASIVAEQVAHGLGSIDTSLRTTVKILAEKSDEDLKTRVTQEKFVNGLRTEREDLMHASLFAVVDDQGEIISGSRGPEVYRINVSDRDYFKTLRDNPDHGLFVSDPVVNRATGTWAVVLARRLSGPDGRFLGVVFVGVAPPMLLQTTNAITDVPGQTFSLQQANGGFLVRRPAATKNTEIGKPIVSPMWHAAVAAGGGMYHSDGWYDEDPKYVAVRPVANFPFVVNVAVSDKSILAKWRRRAMIIVAGGVVAALLVGALLWAQLYMRERLARARIRSWMRGRRLSAKADELAGVSKRFGLTLDYMSQGMAMFDPDRRLIVSNHCYAELYGIDPAKIAPRMHVRDILELRIAAGAYAGAPEDYLKRAIEIPRTDSVDTLATGRVVLVRVKPTEGGGWVTMQEDVTERMKSTERLAHMALHDNLTQLPNRAGFRKRLARVANLDLAADEQAVVFLIDLDDFKSVNDAYGHDVGDKVLIEVAARLRQTEDDIFIARLGGDEFAVMARRSACPSECAMQLAEKLLAGIGRSMSIDGRSVLLSASIGAVVIGGQDGDTASVLRRADLALLEAKQRGRGQACVFDVDMERRYEERAGLAKDLREAIDSEALEVFYQPIVAEQDCKIVCMEALLRWRHPAKGMISPAVFIPIAEQNGLILRLGDWVMRRACADAALWPSDICVAVNVSSLQIAQPHFADNVADALRTTGLAPARLQIEITESVLLQNDQHTIAELNAAHEMGVSFALDDFGTGYASLAYLKVIPLDKVKVDKCFVDDVCTNPQSIAIVGAVVALARGLGIVTTAEGVETREQYETLAALGVMTMQGYYFGRPAPISEQMLDRREDCAA